MRYDFDRIIDRRSTNSMKWNVAEGELPMWVADMDFATVPEVTEMLQRRAAHGLFGYAEETDQWRQLTPVGWRERITLRWRRTGWYFYRRCADHSPPLSAS